MFDGVTLETLAMLLALAYLVLAMRENSLCWYCAFVSTALYVWVFGDVSLYMESALNAYYMVMAVYGWHQWRGGGEQGHGVAPVSTDAPFPYLDSLTTWGSVLTTFMVARKVVENWLYWLVIDSLSIYLYIDRGLYQTAGLFTLYLLLALLGYLQWSKAYRKQNIKASRQGTGELEKLEKDR